MSIEAEKRWLVLAVLDPNQFIRFYDKYYDRIYNYLYRKTLDHELAKDLTADTFLHAQQNLKKFEWRGIFVGSWLYRIATNEFLAHCRRSRRIAEFGLEADGVPDPAHSVMTQIVLDEEQRAVYEAVMELDEPAKSVFLLHYWEEQGTREISEILEIPKGTVSTLLTRGREKLRRRLKKHYFDKPDMWVAQRKAEQGD